METIELSLNIGEVFINSREDYSVIIVEGESAKRVKHALKSHDWKTSIHGDASSSSESKETPTTQASTK